MTAALEPEPTMQFAGASDADLAVLEKQLADARAAEPELFEPDKDPEPQAGGELDEPTGAQETKADNAAEPSAGTLEDTKPSDTEPKAELPKVAAKPAEPAADPNAKPKSKFARDQERLDKTWKSVNERKAELEAREAEIKAQQEKFAAERKEWEAKLAESQPTRTAEEYEAAAAYYEKQGKLETADDFRAAAKELRANPPKPRTPTVAKAELENAQRESWKKVKGEIPEMFDAKHPLNAEMKQWLEQHGGSHPVMQLAEGPHLIAHFLKTRHELGEREKVVSRVPVLEKQVAELTAKNKELEQLVSVQGGGLTTQPKPRRFEDMSEAEQEEFIKRQIAQAG